MPAYGYSVFPFPLPAATDRGSAIALWTVPDHDSPSPEAERKLLLHVHASLRIIPTQAPSIDSDCHGWIFANGRHWILDRDVPRNLRDNDYQTVSSPRPGDLIV